MRKLWLVLAGLLIGTPVWAQESLPTNYENDVRNKSRFNKTTVIRVGGDGLLVFPPLHANVDGIAFRQNALISSNTSTTAVSQLVLPPNALHNTGRGFRIRVHGICAANGNTKVVNFLYGTQSIALLNAAANAKDFYADIMIYRTGLNAQEISVAGYANAALLNGLSVAATQTETASVTIKVSIPATTGAADVVLDDFTIYGESG